MYLSYFILNLMCLSNNKYNINNKSSHERFNDFLKNNNINEKTDTSGNDERPLINVDNDLELMNNNINFQRKRILDVLISPNVATLQKIKIIDDYDILQINSNNIFNGGLLDDFDFDIEL